MPSQPRQANPPRPVPRIAAKPQLAKGFLQPNRPIILLYTGFNSLFGRKKMKPTILVLLGVALVTQASAKIGWSLDQCISEYGRIIQKYGDNETSLPEYEFLIGDIDVTVIMLDGKVAQIDISPLKPFSNSQILTELSHYSGVNDWERRPHTDISVSGKISGFLPSEAHEYYRSPKSGLIAMVKRDWVGSRKFFLKITIPEHKDALIKYQESRKKNQK